MAALQKRKDRAPDRGRSTSKAAPEAFLYEDDVTPERVESIQEKANKVLGDEEWIVIDGYVGKK